MSRLVTILLLLAATLAACGVQAGPSATPAAQPTSSPASTPEPADPSVEPDPTASPEPTAPPAPSWSGHPAEGLALVRLMSETDPFTQVFVVEADGTLRQVTGLDGGTGASFPVWSPDGTRIAFTGPKRGETTVSGMLAVVNADGSDERQIAEGQFPRWSPDGTTIVFQEVDDVTGQDLSFYLVDPETGDITDLGLGYDARWIGNDRLVFVANSYAADGLASAGLNVMSLEDGAVTPIEGFTSDQSDPVSAHPSPDSAMLLLVRDGVVSLSRADGPLVQLVEGGTPVWAPDGTRFAVVVGHDNDANPVWSVVDLDGRVLQSDIVGAYATWSPDGTRLALEVYRPDQPVIQVVDVATAEVVWEEQGRSPAWRP